MSKDVKKLVKKISKLASTFKRSPMLSSCLLKEQARRCHEAARPQEMLDKSIVVVDEDVKQQVNDLVQADDEDEDDGSMGLMDEESDDEDDEGKEPVDDMDANSSEGPCEQMSQRKPRRIGIHNATRWNGLYRVAKREYELRDAIDTVLLDAVSKEKLKKKRERLCRVIPTKPDDVAAGQVDEWSEIKELAMVFHPCYEVTMALQQEKMPTISFLYPLLQMLHAKVKTIRLTSARVQAIRSALQDGIAVRFFTHDVAPECVLLACALDPRTKSFDWGPVWKAPAYSLLKKEYDSVRSAAKDSEEKAMEIELPVSSYATPVKSLSFVDQCSLFPDLTPTSTVLDDNEFDVYLKKAGLPLITADSPLEWWKRNESSFPILADLARKYLSIPASEAPSERLFSAGTNTVTKKRTRLKPSRAAKIIFLKFNSKLIRKYQKIE